MLTLWFATWAPVNALACSGAIAAGGGGSPTSGGGTANPFGSMTGPAASYAAAGFLFLVAIVLVAIALAVAMRRRQPAWTLAAQVSPDGMYWWDGTSWRPIPRS